jgi:hypothetical protein
MKTVNTYRSSHFDNTNPDELTSIDLDLFPLAVLQAAQEDLGREVITDYFREMYEFGISSQQMGMEIKRAQLTGITLTHKKLERWLKAQNIEDFTDLSDPNLLTVHLKYHIKQMQDSVDVFQQIVDSLTRN